jgi:hypothetical protein
MLRFNAVRRANKCLPDAMASLPPAGFASTMNSGSEQEPNPSVIRDP